MAFTYSPIASVTVGSGGASSITFNDIPQNYTDLVVKVSARSSVNDTAFTVQFNGSTTAYYTRNLLTYVAAPTAGTAASSTQSNTASASLEALEPSTYTANTFNSSEIYIPNYAGSTNKSFSADTVTENNGTQSMLVMVAGLLSNTTAITSIKLSPATSGNFVQYSTAYLYGIRATEY